MPQNLARQTRFTQPIDEESWQALSLAQEPMLPARLNGLDHWSADDLLSEIVRRSADDVPALRMTQEHVLRALLVAMDRDALGPESQHQPP